MNYWLCPQALAKYAFGLGLLQMFLCTLAFSLFSLPVGKGIGTQILEVVSLIVWISRHSNSWLRHVICSRNSACAEVLSAEQGSCGNVSLCGCIAMSMMPSHDCAGISGVAAAGGHPLGG